MKKEKSTKQVEERVNSDEKTEQISETEKKERESPDIFLLPHLSVWSPFSPSWLPDASGTPRSQNLEHKQHRTLAFNIHPQHSQPVQREATVATVYIAQHVESMGFIVNCK